MRYQSSLVPVGEREPPEDALAYLAGGCGRWQISVGVVACIAEVIHGLNLHARTILETQAVNFTCENGNGSRCFDVDGHKCKKFIFYKPHNFTTSTEKFLLVCEKGGYVPWIDYSFHIGILISYWLVGWTADRCGRKVAAMTFIPLHCLTGVLTMVNPSFETVIVFQFIHGIFSSSINILPKVAVCDTVGNKWRTFALGITNWPLSLTWLIMVYFTTLSSGIDQILGTVSVLPLILLIPLLYFRDSPHSILCTNSADFVEAEEAFRKIAAFNHRPMPDDIKIRPVAVIGTVLPKETCYKFWKNPTTKYPFTALLCFWFLEGITVGLIFHLALEYYTDTSKMLFYGLAPIFGPLIGPGLCHLMPHRVVIGLFSSARNLVVLTMILLPEYLPGKMPYFFHSIRSASLILFRISFSSLDNLTPRMFPTACRSHCLGICFSSFYAGQLLMELIHTFINPMIYWIVDLIFIVLCLLAEPICCFWFWEVHNRELPDFVQDCVHFKKFYKPLRFTTIHETPVDLTPSLEIEVQTMDLSQEKIPPTPVVTSKTKTKTKQKLNKPQK